MMSGDAGHLEDLLSRAYDGDLDANQRALVDRHLTACRPCSAAYADLATAVEAVRSLPPARMPHAVRLPEGLPGAAARRRPWSRQPAIPAASRDGARPWTAFPRRHPWVSGLLGSAATAAVIAAIVIPSTLGGGPAPRGTASGLSPANGPAGSSAGSGAQHSVPLVPGGSGAGCPVALSPGGRPVSTAIPAVYNNHEVQDDGATTVILATSVSSYGPGETVEIYARLVDDRTGAVSLPCAFLQPTSAALPQAGLSVPTAGAAAIAPTVPAERGLAGGLSVLQVQVPATAAAGETLEIVVEVPASGGEPAHQATLPIIVR